jgi:drug/metabolite transporter (DMT)-like permease
MPLFALALVLLAAILHAGWNYLAKSAHDASAFLWWAILIGATGYGLYIFITQGIYLPRQVWFLYALSIGAEVLYLITLVRGYSTGDLSLVYPLARGSAPILVTIWSALFLDERLPSMGYLGVALMVAGILVVSWQPNRAFSPPRNRLESTGVRPASNAVFWALASGFFVSIYSVLDKIIVNSVAPLVYNFWVYAGIAVAWAPFVWIGRGAVARNVSELRRGLPRILIGSVMTIGTYVSVLVALTQTSASYVVAGRGTSVVIGALLGWLLLREGFGWQRVMGAALMVAGLTLIAFAP